MWLCETKPQESVVKIGQTLKRRLGIDDKVSIEQYNKRKLVCELLRIKQLQHYTVLYYLLFYCYAMLQEFHQSDN